MKKKVLAMILAVSMLMTGLSGCGKKTEETESSGTNTTVEVTGTAGEQSAATNFHETGYPIVDEPITLNVMFAIRDVDSLIEPNDMAVIQALEKEFFVVLVP